MVSFFAQGKINHVDLGVLVNIELFYIMGGESIASQRGARNIYETVDKWRKKLKPQQVVLLRFFG